jgi:hypothetical protein
MADQIGPGLPVEHAPSAPESLPDEPRRRWWSPRSWAQVVHAKWRGPGPLTDEEKRGFVFWVPVALAIAAVELAGAASGAFRDFIPWPTISSTIGHLEEGASWVGVVVVAVIAMVAYSAVSGGGPVRRTAQARAIPPDAPHPKQLEIDAPVIGFRYSWPTVLLATGLVARLVNSFDDQKYVLGYAIYGSFLVFGVLIPSGLVRWANRDVRFPPLLLPLRAFSTRFRSTPKVIVAGLAILVIHLALYPWPDLTRESASYAGLKAGKARARAVGAIKTARSELPQLVYSAQTRGIAEGRDAWLVYFSPASGSGALPYSGCVVVVSKAKTEPSAECLK